MVHMTTNTTVRSEHFVGDDENGPFIGVHIELPNDHPNAPGSQDFDFVDMKFQGEGTGKVFTLGVSAVDAQGNVEEYSAKVVFEKDINSSGKFVGHQKSEIGGELFNAPESVSKLLKRFRNEIFDALGEVVQPVTTFTQSGSSFTGSKPVVTDTKDPGKISVAESFDMQLLLSTVSKLTPFNPDIINSAPQR